MTQDNKLAQTLNTEWRKPAICLCGQYQNGKSTFLNCLLGGYYAAEGDGTATTVYKSRYTFGDILSAKVIYSDGTAGELEYPSLFQTKVDMPKDSSLKIQLYSPTLEDMDILDTPGIGFSEAGDELAENAAKSADFIIYMVRKELYADSDIPFLENLMRHGKNFSVILNCYNDSLPDSEFVKDLCQEIASAIRAHKLDNNYIPLSKELPVYPVNLLFAKAALGYCPPGEQKKNWNKTLSFIDREISRDMVLNLSNFMPLRRLLGKFVCNLFHYTPNPYLDIMTNLAERWASALSTALKRS